jgi:hypothetical protein
MTTTTQPRTANHNYFSEAIIGQKNARKFIREARKALKDVDFDTFVVRGMSGMGAGALLSNAMDKELYVIRKGEECHDWRKGFGSMGQRWVFLDDLIDSGATLSIVKGHMEEAVEKSSFEYWTGTAFRNLRPKFIGAYLFVGTNYGTVKGFTPANEL